MLVKIEARILIFTGTDFYFPSTSVPPGTFFRLCRAPTLDRCSLSQVITELCLQHDSVAQVCQYHLKLILVHSIVQLTDIVIYTSGVS